MIIFVLVKGFKVNFFYDIFGFLIFCGCFQEHGVVRKVDAGYEKSILGQTIGEEHGDL